MFFKNYSLIFLFFLISGTFIAISSNSWFTSWIGLEINLMSMIPLILIKLDSKMTEAAIKYFLAQALASIILIFSISINFILNETSNLEILEIFIMISLIIKSGMAPFHFWFPQVSNFLNWTQCFILFTWQKIAPLLLMFSMNLKNIFLFSMMSAIVGALGGLNQSVLKLLMTYSSISHGGWMLLGCSLNIFIWLLYFLIYSFLSLTILSSFYMSQLVKLNQIFVKNDFNLNKNILILNFFSLGGLPPLMGFIAKLSVISLALKHFLTALFIPLILSSVVSLFFYTRVLYSSLMNKNKKINFFVFKNKKPNSIFFSLSIFFNLIFPSIFILT